MPDQTNHDRSSQSPEAALLEMLRGYQLTQLVYVATRLGIPDLLADGPKDRDQLAVACGAHPNAPHRLLRALVGLAGLGVFEQVEPGRFALPPLSASLRSGLPGSLYSSAILAGELSYGSWGQLLDSLRTGSTAFERVHGMPFFGYAHHPEDARLFDEQMASGEERYAAIARSYDFSRFRTVVDIGGGRGG
jgi:hypothetical protein